MNKDKIIKDLKERNDKLSNQYRLRDIRCITLENRIYKVNQIIDELLLIGTNEYEIEEQLEEIKRVLGGTE